MVKGLVSLVFIVALVVAIVVGVVKEIKEETLSEESPVTVDTGIIDQVNIVSDVGIGIVEPKEVGLEYPQSVIDQGSPIGYALLGVDMETMDYIPLRMDVQGYIMCKDVNQAIFKLVPKE